MRRLSILLILFLSTFTVVFALKVNFYVSNMQVYLALTSTPLKIKVGYPYTSAEVGRKSYVRLEIREATPVIVGEGMWNVWKSDGFFVEIGGKAKVGELRNAFNNSKIKEIGRVYLSLSTCFENEGFQASLLYSRFILSTDKGITTNAFFFLPANYLGEMPNTIDLKLRYSHPISKKVGLSASFETRFQVSDGGILSPPTFEVGISISTTLGNLKDNFKSPASQ